MLYAQPKEGETMVKNEDPSPVVSRDEWLDARKKLMAKEKELTRLRDELSAERRRLPRTRVEKRYVFDTAAGEQTLADLFDGRSQLLVYHFMFPASWDAGCKSCSFWADGYDGIGSHLNARNVTLVAISKAPIQKLEAFRKRMGWSFTWVSSARNEFNRDFGVSFTVDEIASKAPLYNFETLPFGVEEAPGVSVFYRGAHGEVFHTYSCYARGLDLLNLAYNLLDLVPKGRDEDGLPYSMAWLRLHDEYGR
jgi:predicted dithiol-disulfide oxidoreductase (DUF899 family)